MYSRTKFDLQSLVIILVVVAAAMPLVFGGVTFDNERDNLSNNDESASSNARFSTLAPTTIQSVVANGSNVYVAWFNATVTAGCEVANPCGVIFKKSADNGTTFSTEIKLGTSTSFDPHPSIAVGRTGHVYVVWYDGTDIKIGASSNSGQSFNIRLDTDIGDADPPSAFFDQARPQIVANSSGNNVYVAWTDNTRYKLVRSDDDFATFSTPEDIGVINNGGGTPQVPTVKLGISETHLHVITQESEHIVVKRSGSNGTTASFTNQTLDTDIGAFDNEGFPHIVANFTGDEVYAVWKEASNINFSHSTDNGQSFVRPTTPSNGLLGSIATDSSDVFPEISIGEQGRVFVVWEDDTGTPDVIKFRNSTDGGVTFANAQTLSGTNPESRARIAASDGNVYVVWRENPTTSTNDKITLISSSNNGKSFGTATFLTNDNAHDIVPQVAAANDKVSIAWESHPTTTTNVNGEINYTSATGTAVSITYNATNFKLGETAEITVVDESSDTSGAQQSFSVPIISSTDGDGISVSLDETGGTTGIFTGTFSFTSGSGSSSNDGTDILNVTSGDTITATQQTVTGTASIFPITFTFSEADGDYTVSQQPRFDVTAKSFNLDDNKIETIDVTVTAKNTGDSLTLTLTETTGSSGVFGGKGTTEKNLVLVNSTVTNFPVGRTATITSTTSTVDVFSSSDPTFASTTGSIIGFALTESSPGSGIFTGKITFGSTTAGSTIAVNNCDTLTVRDNTLDQNRLMTPCNDDSIKALSVSLTISTTDTMTVTFDGISSAFTIKDDDGGSGGGGGGLVRPSLVLDAILGVAGIGGGGSGAPILTLDQLQHTKIIDIPDHIQEIIDQHDPLIPIEPLEDDGSFDFPLSIDGQGYPLVSYSNTIKTKTVRAGEPTNLKVISYDSDDLAHISLYLNLRGALDKISQSDTQILWNLDEPIKIIDPHGFFESVNIVVSEEEGFKKEANFEINFATSMEKSDLIIRQWDENLQSRDTIVMDVLEVLPPLPETPPENLEEQTEESSSTVPIQDLQQEPANGKVLDINSVPEWVKNNAGWWADGQISQTEFIQAIEFLSKQGIINIPPGPIDETGKTTQSVPDWIKNTAEWWSDDLITEDEFVAAIQWLATKGIITL